MDSVIWFLGWLSIAVPLWLIAFGVFYISGFLVTYYSPANRKGANNDFSRN